MLDAITQDTLAEALDAMESTYKNWLGLKLATDAERELAKEKIRRVEHARTVLSELMRKSPGS